MYLDQNMNSSDRTETKAALGLFLTKYAGNTNLNTIDVLKIMPDSVTMEDASINLEEFLDKAFSRINGR